MYHIHEVNHLRDFDVDAESAPSIEAVEIIIFVQNAMLSLQCH